jgi:hypothetical protein
MCAIGYIAAYNRLTKETTCARPSNKWRGAEGKIPLPRENFIMY